MATQALPNYYPDHGTLSRAGLRKGTYWAPNYNTKGRSTSASVDQGTRSSIHGSPAAGTISPKRYHRFSRTRTRQMRPYTRLGVSRLTVQSTSLSYGPINHPFPARQCHHGSVYTPINTLDVDKACIKIFVHVFVPPWNHGGIAWTEVS